MQSISGSSSPSQDDLSELASSLDGLALESKPQLWTVGWDTFVTILDDSKGSEKKVNILLI